MKRFNSTDLYVVHPDFKLRNEQKYIIAANYGLNGTGEVVRLAPIEGLIISLLDGTRTLKDVAEICTALVPEGSPENDADALVETVLEKNQTERQNPLVVLKTSLSGEEQHRLRYYDPIQFIIPRVQWNLEDTKLLVPASIFWIITNDCQTDCQYCYMPRTRFTKKEMLPWERTSALIREAHDLGVMLINLSGGDIFCYPNIHELLTLLGELQFEPIDLSTKAVISSEVALRIAEHRILKTLQFSIDSTVPEIADYLVKRKGFCENILQSIDASIKAGIRVTTKTVITPYNLPTIPKLYRDLKRRGVSKVVLATYCRSGFHHKEQLFNHLSDYKWLDAELSKLREEFPQDDIFYQNGPPQTQPRTTQQVEEIWKNRVRCTAGREAFAVTASGKVIACEQMPEREDDYFGDLRTQSIEEVWNGKQMDEYLLHPPRNKFIGTVCFNCAEYDECQAKMGVCVRDSCIHYGTRWSPATICPQGPGPQREM